MHDALVVEGSEQQRLPAGRVRRPASREQWVALGVVTGVSVIAAGAIGGSPTGVAMVDLVYRTGFVVVMVFAGSRARRWSLIVGAAIATVAGLGPFLLAGLIAMLLCVALVLRDLRDRVWGATIGGLVAIACLGLTVDVFLGASFLVGLAASTGILVSGYRNCRTRTRRGIRWAVGGVAAVWVIGVLGAGVVVVLSFRPLSASVDDASEAANSLRGGDTDAGTAQLVTAAKGFDDVHALASAWWAAPSRVVPVIAQHVTALSELSRAGAELSRAAADVGANVDYDELRRVEGGIDLDKLESFSEPILQAEAALDRAIRSVDDVRSPWLAGPLSDQIATFDGRLVRLQSDVELAATAVRGAPDLLGGDVPRRYLILLGNPAESRDLGGHVGNWAELVIDRGVLDLVQVGRPLELSRPENDDLELASRGVPESLLTLQPSRYPQNWGGHLDFPTDASMAGLLFEKATGRAVDGVMYADPYVLASMLSVTGPVPVPGSTAVVDVNNAVSFLTRDQFTVFDSATGDQVITDLVRDLFERFVSTQLPGPETIGQRFGPNVREGRLRLVTVHAQDAELLGRVGLNYGFPRDDDTAAFIAVVHSNANPSKIDTFLTRNSTIKVRWDPITGDLTTTVRVELRNDAPAISTLPVEVVGNGNGLPIGTNTMQLAVLSNSKELESVTLDGRAVPSSSLEDGVGFRHQLRVDVGPGQTRVVEMVILDLVDPGDRFQLFVAGQPTVNRGSIAVKVEASTGRMARGRQLEVSGRRATTAVPGDQNSRISLSVVM